MEIEIRKLEEELYRGHRFTLRYTTKGYYDIRRTDMGFQLVYEQLTEPVEMSFDDFFFTKWDFFFQTVNLI